MNWKTLQFLLVYESENLTRLNDEKTTMKKFKEIRLPL